MDSQRQYWRFYWPLAVTGLAMLLTRQFQNGVLARYPDATRELAVFAYASSLFFLFNAALGFVPQMANALARSTRSSRVCFRFLLGVSIALTLPLAALAFLPLGQDLVGRLFHIRGDMLDAVILYLRILTPLLVLNAARQFQTGLLVQVRRTGVVTWLNGAFLGTMLLVLIVGFSASWRAAYTLALARLIGAGLHLLLTWVFRRRLVALPEKGPEADLTYGQALAFFWPLALTSTMFALSRPILFTFISRTRNAEVTVAALRIAFDFAMIFHMPLNQFRHLFVTFGEKDLAGLRRFMGKVLAGLSLTMLLITITPLSSLCLEYLLGVSPNLARDARWAILVLCLVPLVVTVRNYFHGLCLLRRRTLSMGVGAVFRNAAILTAAWACFQTGVLHTTWVAALVLVFGFAAETAVVMTAFFRSGTTARREV